MNEIARCPEHGPFGPACPVCVERDALAFLDCVLTEEGAPRNVDGSRDGDPAGQLGGIVGRVRSLAREVRYWRNVNLPTDPA